jgi:hypothetical protein
MRKTPNTSYEMAKIAKQALESKVKAAGAVVAAFPHDGLYGMAPESVRLSPEYREAKRKFDLAFSALRKFNSEFCKRYHKERRAERRRAAHWYG